MHFPKDEHLLVISCLALGVWAPSNSWAIVSREDWLALPNETLFVPKEWNERGDDGDDG